MVPYTGSLEMVLREEENIVAKIEEQVTRLDFVKKKDENEPTLTRDLDPPNHFFYIYKSPWYYDHLPPPHVLHLQLLIKINKKI